MARKPKAATKHTQIESISIFGATARMAPLGLIMYAKWVLSASKPVSVSSEIGFNPARTYLACHSVELSLKAFLSLKGHSLIKLAGGEFAHKLDSLLESAETHGLGSMVVLSEHHRYQICRASEYYSEKVFEYPSIGESLTAYSRCPDTGVVIEAADLLADGLYERCLRAD